MVIVAISSLRALKMSKFALVLLVSLTVAVAGDGALAWESKVGASLQAKAKTTANVLVSFKQSTRDALQQVTHSASHTRASHAEKATAVYTALKSLADSSQAQVLEFLNFSGRNQQISIRSLWVTNQIYVQNADRALIEALASFDEVSRIEQEVIVKLDDFPLKKVPATSRNENGVLAEWGIDKIQAYEAWAEGGTDGTGVVVGILDTGTSVTHQDLRGSYRGGDHSWYNPYRAEPEPSDQDGHGTFVTGVAVGAGGIGVAPGAKWISCKGFDGAFSTNAGLIACGQFFICPHDYLGNNPDCSLAADVSSNSWGAANFFADWYDDVIEAYHASGIIPVFANGNFGPNCATGTIPANSVADVIAVGATTGADALAEWSSRGPGPDTPVMTPHVAAPGQDIVSAYPGADDQYAIGSGTSMATPHVAGLAALLKSVQRDVPYLTLKTLIQTNADRNLTFNGQVCGGLTDSLFPNYQFGYGRINALKAVRALVAMQP